MPTARSGATLRSTARLWTSTTLAIGAGILLPSASVAQEGTPAWIGLYTWELVTWLENENRITELCGDGSGVDDLDCRTSHMEPKVAVIPVRPEPGSEARVGELVLLALPGRGLRIFTVQGKEASPFRPDLHDGDWGYGPYFHQTVLERRGSWFRIPVPGLGTGWIDWAEWGGGAAAGPGGEPGGAASPQVERLSVGEIVVTPLGDMVVLGLEEGGLRMRPEDPADFWCEAGTPPARAPRPGIRIPFEELYDEAGHLLIAPKYLRGC